MHRPGRVCVLSASLGSLNASDQFPRPSGPAAPCLASSAHHPFLHPHPRSCNSTHKSCMHAHHTPCLPTHPYSRTHTHHIRPCSHPHTHASPCTSVATALFPHNPTLLSITTTHLPHQVSSFFPDSFSVDDHGSHAQPQC